MFCCLGQIVAAQFTLNPSHFGKEFSQQLTYTGDIRKDGASMSKEFLTFWQSDTLTSAQRDNFIRCINKLQSKGCKPFPDYVRFVDNLMAFERNGIDYSQYEKYEKAVVDMVDAGRKVRVNDLSDFLHTMNLLLRANVVCYNQRTNWKVNKMNVLMTYENKKFQIRFDDVDLVGFQDRDSLKIYNTSGVLNPIERTWVGNGGLVGWERVGYPIDSMSVSLGDYNLNLADIGIKADSVVFRNKYYFTQDLMGDLNDKAQNGEHPEKSTYPRFVSYSQNFNIKNIVKDVDYRGGLSVRGRNFIGSGTEERKAEIRITKNDSVSFSAYAQSFVFDPDKIVSDDCEMVLRLAQDSIYHPCVSMRYTIVRRKIEKESEEQSGRRRKVEKQYDEKENGYLEVIRTQDGLSKMNFVDTYHMLSMNFTSLKWVVDKSIIDLATVNTQGTPSEVVFESADYYTYDKYKSLKQQDARNPLEVVASVVSWVGYPEFTLGDLVTYMKIGRDQAIQLIYRLVYQGYLTYDAKEEKVTVREETWRMLNAHKGDTDSDVILFYSKVKSSEGVMVDDETKQVVRTALGNDTVANAKLSLSNFDLKMFGVPYVHLSDSQSVTVYPRDQKLVIQKNRNFIFDGLLQAGQFYMYGSGFNFNYNQFRISVPNCDSMKIVAMTTPEMGFLDNNGQPKVAIVRNKLENISGDFYIDYPSNKSGFADYKEYPKLVSSKETFVYYDSPQIFNGIYDREKFYFKVDPFTIDSIDGYSKENIHFAGTLVSNGIIPDLKETLVVRQSDWSLGFEYKTPSSGVPIYNGKATFRNNIDLSNKGLRAEGTINYLSTTFTDAYATLFPDELEGHSKKMNVEARKSPVQFPKAECVENTLRWEVNKDKFHVDKDTANFVMYDGQARLDGNMLITTQGVHGEGTTFIERAMLVSEDFVYNKDDFDADTADFSLYKNNISDIDFEGKGQKSHIDFVKRRGDFMSNGEGSEQNFPKNKYKCTADKTTWYMDKEELAFSASDEVKDKLRAINPENEWELWESAFIEGSRFESYMTGQDRLSFYVPEAIYNYRDYIINAKNVGVIRVADAAIFPKTDVVLRENAVMDTLVGARITANVTSEYYKFYNAKVKIKGKRDYIGEADYDYINETKSPQKIHFSEIKIAEGETRAYGEISEPDNFNITRHFGYQGSVNAYAGIDSLEYIGAARINYECDTANQWFKFKSFVSDEAPFIPIDKDLKSINNLVLRSSVMLGNGKVYPAFIAKRRGVADEALFDVNGYLQYNEESGKFEISSLEKLYEHNLPGNYMSIDASTCNIEGEGEFIFSKNLTYTFNVNSFGKFTYNRETDTTEFNTTMFMNIPLPSSAFDYMAKTIPSVSSDYVDENDEAYHVALKQFLDTAEYNKYMTNISFGNYEKIPKLLTENKIVMTDLHFIYDRKSQTKGIVCGGPIGFVSFGKHHVSRYVSGYIRVTKTKGAEAFEMLVEPDGEMWFYFMYKNGILKTISSEEKYNSIIADSKEKPLDNYSVILEGTTDKNKFKKEMDKKFLNTSSEY